MSAAAWLTLAVLIGMIIVLVRERLDTTAALVGAVGLLLVCGVLTPERALAGLASPAVAVVGLFSLLVLPLSRSGFLTRLSAWLFHRSQLPPPVAAHSFRALAPVVFLSAFVANTPVVASLIPTVRQWARRNGMAPSRVLMSLSFAAILGGTCTLIGTSTNLAVHGLLLAHGFEGLGFFEIGRIGLPVALLGLLFLRLAGPRLLPDRLDPLDALERNPREYLARLQVVDPSRLPGPRVGDFRRLPRLFLVAVERGHERHSPANPDLLLQRGDVLVFAGQVSTIAEMAQTPGLAPAAEADDEPLDRLERQGYLVEAVVSPSSPLLGKTIRDANIRGRYDAVVLGVHRHGERIPGRIGDVVIRAGDTFLLLVGRDFLTRHRYSQDFYLVSHAGDVRHPMSTAVWLDPAVLVLVVALAALGVLPLLSAAALGVVLLLVLRRLQTDELLAGLPLGTLMIIAASVALSNAVEDSGLAAVVVHFLKDAGSGMGRFGVIALLVGATGLLTEVLTNVAAASLAFPVAMQLAIQSNLDPRVLAMAVAVAASTSFLTPIGYHTNAMVAGPGGYTAKDFLRFGAPLKWLAVGVLIPLTHFYS